MLQGLLHTVVRELAFQLTSDPMGQNGQWGTVKGHSDLRQVPSILELPTYPSQGYL